MARHESASAIARLGGLLEVSRLIRAEEDLPVLLGAIAKTIADSLGYGTVAVNLYRPAWDDFVVTTVHGSERARDALLGEARTAAEWQPLLDERFLRRGAYLIVHGELDWNDGGARYVPQFDPLDGADAWHPEDALFVPMRHIDGHLVGIVSVDEPQSGLRPTDEELDVLVAVADHAALAVQNAQEAGVAARHRAALEQLLAVSSQLTATPSIDAVLRGVCEGIRDALGFRNVSVELVHGETRVLEPKAAVGWDLAERALTTPVTVADVEPLLDPKFEVEGCFLVPHDEAASRIAAEHVVYVSSLNGRGPWAWDRHWLLVPLRERDEVIGMIWADEPEDRLLPARGRLQALRVFANQASAAIAAASHFQELRFYADHDPLTRLLNRRAFIRRLDDEVARTARYGRAFSLVLCDLDGFKGVNDLHGHPGGDEALQAFAAIVSDALRRPDDAFRIGGDEFAFLLAEASDGDATAVVARICALLEQSGDERLTTLRASFGVASCPAHARDAQALFRVADEALYKAKRAGVSIQFAAA